MRIGAFLLAIVISLAGCASFFSNAGEDFNLAKYDIEITLGVKTKFSNEKVYDLTKVDIDTNNGHVYLNGLVDSNYAKARAEQLAWQVKYVKSVVNNLQVQKKY